MHKTIISGERYNNETLKKMLQKMMVKKWNIQHKYVEVKQWTFTLHNTVRFISSPDLDIHSYSHIGKSKVVSAAMNND